MLLRDRLEARLAGMGGKPDFQRLAAEELGIRNAPPELARVLVSQALVIEDRRDEWRRVGERVCADAPAAPGVYVLRDDDGRALYVGKAVNLRRRLRTHFSARRWRALKPEFVRASAAEWVEVGSELEALLREAALIADLRPPVNVQTAAPAMATRAVPAALKRDVLVIQPSVEAESVELVAARADGGWMIERTRRDGVGLVTRATRLMRFFRSPLRRAFQNHDLAPIVFSWLSGRGQAATRVDPNDFRSPAALGRCLRAVLADGYLFGERIVVIDSKSSRRRAMRC